jgi:antitoxin component of MazEF toxin-antitoxin module
MKLFLNSGSYKVTIPPAIIRSLKWKDRDELEVKQVGNTLVLSLKKV